MVRLQVVHVTNVYRDSHPHPDKDLCIEIYASEATVISGSEIMSLHADETLNCIHHFNSSVAAGVSVMLQSQSPLTEEGYLLFPRSNGVTFLWSRSLLLSSGFFELAQTQIYLDAPQIQATEKVAL